MAAVLLLVTRLVVATPAPAVTVVNNNTERVLPSLFMYCGGMCIPFSIRRAFTTSALQAMTHLRKAHPPPSLQANSYPNCFTNHPIHQLQSVDSLCKKSLEIIENFHDLRPRSSSSAPPVHLLPVMFLLH